MKLHIKNFRSIKQLDLELAPITVLYGHNGTGKSSALYAPLTLRNIVSNPNQEISNFFNYGFTSLGQFSEVIFDHNPKNELELGISFETASVNLIDHEGVDYGGGYDVEFDYRIACLSNSIGSFRFKTLLHDWDGGTRLPIDLLREATSHDQESNYELLSEAESGKTFAWNGVSTNEVTASYGDFVRDVANGTIKALNLPTEELQRVTFVPLGRGFYQPLYSFGRCGNSSSNTRTEQEVTDLLATDRHLEYAINLRMEKVLNRTFHVRADIGSGSSQFSLDSIDRKTGLGSGLVNDGFGVNQLVYMLAKVLHSDAGIVCIEEPEIHLHPTAIRRLARALAEIVQEESSKRLIISTHSEQFIMSLLALVANESYASDDLAMYLVTKEGKESKFDRQQVNESGQVDGGLASFMEGELEDMKAFLGV